MEQKSNTFTQIYDIVRQIPYGKVATYGADRGACGK